MYKQLQDLEWRVSNSNSSEDLKEALDALKEMRDNLTFTNKILQQKIFSQIGEVYNCASAHYKVVCDEEKLNNILTKCETLCKH